VLAGGTSRRMGSDKALLQLDGSALVERAVAALLDAGAASVVVVGGDARALTDLGLEVIADDHPGEGPLGGILTALRHCSGAEVVVVLPCDLLCPSRVAVRDIAEALDATSADVVVPVVEDQPQWLHAAWRPTALPGLRAAFAGGERAIHRAAAQLDVAYHHGLEPADVRDADEPHDLAGSVLAVEVPEVDVAQLAGLREAGEPILDVRQPEEYDEAHVPGAQLVPLPELPDRVAEIPAGRTVYVICKSGGRSRKAAEHLRGIGVDAVNVAGGTLAWIESGHAVVTGSEPG
jgi:molybdopterin-guanine dinucleotide biosynthesis protein A/rhodanese-related sulfurtransferase